MWSDVGVDAAAAAAAAAVDSSIRMIAFDSGFECVIMLKSSWSREKTGPFHRGMVLERGVPLDVITFGEYMLRFVGLIPPDIPLMG